MVCTVNEMFSANSSSNFDSEVQKTLRSSFEFSSEDIRLVSNWCFLHYQFVMIHVALVISYESYVLIHSAWLKPHKAFMWLQCNNLIKKHLLWCHAMRLTSLKMTNFGLKIYTLVIKHWYIFMLITSTSTIISGELRKKLRDDWSWLQRCWWQRYVGGYCQMLVTEW